MLYRSLRFNWVAAAAVVILAGRAGQAEHPAVAGNAKAISAIQSYHLKIRQTTALSLEHKGPFVDSAVYEIWCSGLRHRKRARAFLVVSGTGFQKVDEPAGQVVDASVDTRESRTLEGWDPEHPLPLPLEFGRNAKEFRTVRCGIGVRDPRTLVDTVERMGLLWEVIPGWSLKRVSDSSQLVEVPSPSESTVRLRLEASKDATLASHIGMLVDINVDRGSLISRLELPSVNGGAVFVGEVLHFERTANGIWIPVELRGLANNTEFHRTYVVDYSINEPIADIDLQVQFPEGAQVDDVAGRIHLWGKNGPVASFNTKDKFMKHLYARARDFQKKNRTTRLAPASLEGRWPFIVVNAILVVLLALFIVVRRIVGRHVQDPSNK